MACGTRKPAQLVDAEQPGVVPAGVRVVKVQKTPTGFQLLRDGQPYFIRGGAGLQRLGQLRQAGGNSIRLWSTDYAAPLLDEAQQQGLTVTLGIWLDLESRNFTYYDPAMVQAQLLRMREQVLRYRHHPALLMWNVGNEVELSTSSPRFFEAVEGIARMVHELDPYHPVTISMSKFQDYGAQMQKLAPSVDILSVNTYGKLASLPSLMQEIGWQKPYIVSEYGGLGYWEAYTTSWRAPIEQTSADKAQFVKTRYRQSIAADTNHCLGSYIFFWGYKFEYTPTWFSLFEPTGEKTELVDELNLLWNKHYPTNRSPHLIDLQLNGLAANASVQLQAGKQYAALVHVTDPEGDSLTARWEVMPDMPPGANAVAVQNPLESVPGCVLEASGKQATVRAPAKPGIYRLYVRVFDGHGSVGTANVPFEVLGPASTSAYSATTSD